MPIQWDGSTDAGGTAPDGNYTFKVSATSGGNAVSGVALAYGQVASVATSAQGVKLNVPGIGNVDLSDIQQIL
jgi:flagellar basal-body rod modification protein FlgD